MQTRLSAERDKLTPEQVASYHENGFLLVEGLVSPEEVEAIKTDAIRICRGEYPCEVTTPVDSTVPDEEVLKEFLGIVEPHKISPVMLQMVKHPGIVQVLTQLIGPNVKCMQSILFIKPPGYPGQAYHQDEYYIETRDRSLTGAWIALDPATVENGCLWSVPGSHRTGCLYPTAEHKNFDEYDFATEAQAPREGERPLEASPGAVVFFNGYVLHGSRKNRSSIYRRVLVSHYMNAYSPLRWNGQDDYRDIVMVAGEDPYAWKGIQDIAKPWLRPCVREEARAKTLPGRFKERH